MKQTPFIITLTGPTCAGKSTLEDKLVAQGFESVISTTTRPMRNGEVDGVDYYFMDRKTFEFERVKGNFVEAVEFNGECYGVTRAEIERITAERKPIVIVCEPKGRAQIEQFCRFNGWRCFSVFVDCPADVIAERFIRRLMSEKRGVNDEKLIRTYASRLNTIMTDERKWVVDATLKTTGYTLVIDEFNEENEVQIVYSIVKIAQFYGYLRAAA
jgi:guanylate kinase